MFARSLLFGGLEKVCRMVQGGRREGGRGYEGGC